MEILVEGVIVHNPNDIEIIPISVTKDTYRKIRAKLVFERYKIIKYSKELQKAGKIKSIYRPKNKQIKQHLIDICILKRRMKRTIKKIDVIFK